MKGSFDMDKKPVPKGRLYVSIMIPLIWLLFLAFWLFYYATNYSIIQNIGVFLASIVIVAILEVIIWVPWGMKQ
jgi:membrane protein YdbS with pleckstrin-like domain